MYWVPYLHNRSQEYKCRWLIELNIYLLYWYFQQNQCLSIKKHTVHSIHILAMGPFARGAPGQLPSVPMR
jgi:hypothetical protein